MPAKKKKKFIDKKNAVTFHLVHRSQRDPLQANEEAPQRVLLPAEEKLKVQKEEERKYGVFYDDDYDYMQHLKSVDELYEVEAVKESRRTDEEPPSKPNKPVLPSTVFASEHETTEGLLNKAAPQSGPQLDWDPDIIEALDDDFDFENPDNELDDDFVSRALQDDLPEEEEVVDRTQQFINQQREILGHNIDDSLASLSLKERAVDFAAADDELSDSNVSSDFAGRQSDFDEDDLGDMPDFNELETKSRFTDYSISSSVIRRNQGLSLLDDRFEKVYEQYDDDEIGALDQEDISGFIQPGSELLNDALNQFQKYTHKVTAEEVVVPVEADISDSDSDESEEELISVQFEEPKEKWDCESILSTYSNLYNHPKLIEEPKKNSKIVLTKRAQVPAGVLPEKGLTRRQEEQISRLDKVPAYRPKDETTEERKMRKKAVKEERRLRREEKKANKEAFKTEKKVQEKVALNAALSSRGVGIQ